MFRQKHSQRDNLDARCGGTVRIQKVREKVRQSQNAGSYLLPQGTTQGRSEQWQLSAEKSCDHETFTPKPTLSKQPIDVYQ